MNKYLPIIGTVAASIGAALFTPDFLSHHVALFAGLNVAAQLLHSALPSVFK
jgi:hypothetical protein